MENNTRIGIRIDTETKRKLFELAHKNNMKVSSFLRDLINEAYKDEVTIQKEFIRKQN